MTPEPTDPEKSHTARRLRQRLWGAAVLIALAVIVLPLLLDGSGTENRFRQLEAIREAPPPRDGVEGSSASRDDNASAPALGAARAPREERTDGPAPSAWVVQAGSFRQEANAVALRDRLRQQGFASFVKRGERSTAGEGAAFRVNVGPMISRQRADTARQRVDALLGRQSFVDRYP